MPVESHQPSRLASYGRLALDCFSGRRSLKLILGGSLRRRYVKRWLRSHPGQPFECCMPSGGRLLLDPRHWFIEQYYAGLEAFEPDVQGALRHFLKEGDTFVDCGANAGFYSVFAHDVMTRKGVVVAIEANPALLPQLNMNLRANGIERPAVHAAVTLRSGDAQLFVPDHMDVVGGLRRTSHFGRGAGSTVAVPAMTMDHVVEMAALSSVDMIKIDIEGGEMDALRSAEQTIQTFRPILVVEYCSTNWREYGTTPGDLQRLCAAWKYQVRRFDVSSSKPVPVDPAFWEEPLANLVLMPGEGSERDRHS